MTIAAITPSAAPAPADPALAKAAQAFEAIFVRQMLAAVRQASLGDGLFDSQASAQFREMLDAQTADLVAKQGLGIGASVAAQYKAFSSQVASPDGSENAANKEPRAVDLMQSDRLL